MGGVLAAKFTLSPFSVGGKVQPQANHSPRFERLDKLCVTVQLLRVALLLFVEEVLQVASFMGAGFEIDDPANALGIDETSVDDLVSDLSCLDTAECPLRPGITMPGIEQPACAMIACQFPKDIHRALHGLFNSC